MHVQRGVRLAGFDGRQMRGDPRSIVGAPANVDIVPPRDAQGIGQGQVHRDRVRIDVVEGDRRDRNQYFQPDVRPGTTKPARQRPPAIA
jgi:hypothetical protein